MEETVNSSLITYSASTRTQRWMHVCVFSLKKKKSDLNQ